MSNNIANLNGFLSIETLKPVTLNRRQQTVSVTGWVYTSPTALGGRHPFVATGTPAQVILEQARLASSQSDRSMSEFPDTRLGVTVRGKLISMPDRSFLEIKHISFFDLSNPLLQGQEGINSFVANAITLQGHLSLSTDNPCVFEVDGKATKVISASIFTDPPNAGGKHPVLLAGKLADLLQDWIRDQPGSAASSTLSATLGGRLISLERTIYVLAYYLSLGVDERPSEKSFASVQWASLSKTG